MHRAAQTGIERSCPVCGSNSYVHFADEHIDTSRLSNFTYASRKQPEFMCLRLVKCTGCDLVYAPVPPSNDFLADAYSDAEYDSAIEASAAARSYASALAPFLANVTGRGGAVDVGAGNGALLPWLNENGFSPVIGIEPSQAAVKAAPEAIRPMLRQGMFSRDMIADAKPSLLCLFMTLEHLNDPESFVNVAYDVLEPDGMLAVVVHNWRAPLNRLLGLRSPIIDVEHLQLFSPKSLHTLLERSGFKSIKVAPIENSYPLRYWLRLTPLPACVKVKIAGALERFGLSDTLLPLRVGNMLAVGIKPSKEEV